MILSPEVWILVVSAFVSLANAEIPRDNDDEEETSSPRMIPDFWLYGDMKLTYHQEALLDLPSSQDDLSIPPKAPAATREKTLLWDNGIIPYVFDCSLENMPELQRIVRLAMDDWESKTCLKFVPRKDESETDYVTFFRGTHCYSTVGKARSGRREVSVGFGCEYHHVMVHEIGHVIGFWHEHSRPDRDKYVRIVWKNVNKGWEHAFMKQTWQAVDSLNTPYDYSSIMHYKLNAFSRSSRRKTIVPLKKVRARPYRRISRIDALQVNLMYKCDDKSQRQQSSTNTGNHEGRARSARSLVSIRGYIDQSSNQAKPEKKTDDPNCRDTSKACAYWAQKGFCKTRRDFMLTDCKKSCNSCDAANKVEDNSESECVDDKEACVMWAKHGYCESRPDVMNVKCRKSCRICTEEKCMDRDPRCRAWARWKYCTTDRYKHMMMQACRRSCAFCVAETHDCKDKVASRCPRLKEEGYCKSMDPDVRLRMRNMCAMTCNFCRKVKQTEGDPRPPRRPPCVDTFPMCFGWSRLGYCSSNTRERFMSEYCKRSCNLCSSINPEYIREKCLDNDIDCEEMKKQGHCELERKKRYMSFNCKRTCDLCQRNPAMPPPCTDKHRFCKYWAARGHCHIKALYMMSNCPRSCNICEHGIYEIKNTQAQPCKNKMDDANCEHWAGLGYCQSRGLFMLDKCQHACNSCPKEPVKIQPAQPKGTCSEPLGVGWNFTLPDSAFKASSSLLTGGWDFGAYNARLYKQDNRYQKRIGGWCAKDKQNGHWLQVDLGKIKFVTAVATQGRDKYFEHVKSYELAFSKDGQRWNKYKEDGRFRVLPGNCDNFTPVVNKLIRPIQARFVRFYPRTFNNICMRVEVYGCSRNKGYEKTKTPPPMLGFR